MKKTDYQRIEALLRYLNLSARALSSEIGLSSPQIFYDIKANKCGISKELALKIQEKFFDINAAWLLLGDGEMIKTQSTTGDNNTQVAGNSNQINTISDKFIALLQKKDEQMDRLLTLLEQKNK